MLVTFDNPWEALAPTLVRNTGDIPFDRPPDRLVLRHGAVPIAERLANAHPDIPTATMIHSSGVPAL
jgi:hypothetical protein